MSSALLMIFVTLKLNSSMLTQYYAYGTDRAKQKEFLNSLFSFSLLIGVLIGLGFLVFGDFIFSNVFKDETVKFNPYGILIVLYAVLQEINLCYYIFLKNEKNVASFVFIILFQILTVIILQLVLIVVFDYRVTGALIAMLASNVLTTLIIIIKEKGILTTKINWEMMKPAVSFSLPLIPYLCIYWFLNKGGKFALERYGDLEMVALLGLIVLFSGMIILVVEAIINGIRPFLFEIFANPQDNDDDKINLLTKLIVVVPLLAVPIVVLIMNNIHLICPKEAYQSTAIYSTVSCLMVFIVVYTKMFYQQLVFRQKSGWVTLLSIIVAVVLMLGFVFLIPKYQIWGLLSATLISNIIMAFLFFFAGQYHLKVNYDKLTVFIFPMAIFTLLFICEYICLQYLGTSRPVFGIVQACIIIPVILLFNYKSISDYKRLFIG